MKMVVFLGPTLSVAEAQTRLDAIFLPPAQMGDVYRVALESPFAIGIIDGYFERVPSVWHKEILWALSRRIHVFGAASMGALRAAELAAFGMEGVGDIFRAFHCGDLQDDDEVAVAHAEAADGYRGTSEAMVNIRATLARAVDEGVIDAQLSQRLLGSAKSLFYPDRSYPAIIARTRTEFGVNRQLDGLRAFIEAKRVDAKRRDACLLLERMGQCAKRGEIAEVRSFEVANTEPWSRLRDWARGLPRLLPMEDAVTPSELGPELRCFGERGRGVLLEALARAFARRLSGTCPPIPDAARDRSLAEWRQAMGQEVDIQLADAARDAQIYEEVARRAADKRSLLIRNGSAEPNAAACGLPESYLLEWYLNRVDHEPKLTPPTFDSVAAELGLSEGVALEREAAREYLYVKGKSTPDFRKA